MRSIYLAVMDRSQYDENGSHHLQTIVLRAFSSPESAWKYIEGYEQDMSDNEFFKAVLLNDIVLETKRMVTYAITPTDPELKSFRDEYTFTVQPVMLEE